MGFESTSCPATTPDDELAGRIKQYLLAKHPGLHRVGITADGGIVHLCGAVDSFYLRQLAIAATARVAGVRQLIDDVEVRPPQQQPQEHHAEKP